MSKNYTNYSKPNEAKKQEEVVQAPVETANAVVDPDPAQVPGVTTTPAVVELDPKDAPVATVTPEDDEQTSAPDPEPEVTVGVVSNCKMLNVRAEADKKADILCIINVGDEVEIIEEDSTDEFYYVIAGKNRQVSVEGFCMKDFITIK